MSGQKRTANARTRARQAAFIEALALAGIVQAACQHAEVSRSQAYAWRADKAFADEWDTALVEATERLERAAVTRAVSGVKRDVFYRGRKVGDETTYSDGLLMFLLKARKPDVYRERVSVEHAGPDGDPIRVAAVAGELLERIRTATPSDPDAA